MDPIEKIDIDADSTFLLALEAQRRGHGLYHYLPTDLSYDHGRVIARARPLKCAASAATTRASAHPRCSICAPSTSY
jgi:glutathione synthase